MPHDDDRKGVDTIGSFYGDFVIIFLLDWLATVDVQTDSCFVTDGRLVRTWSAVRGTRYVTIGDYCVYVTAGSAIFGIR